MNEALALLTYAIAAATVGAAALRRASWPEQAPRLGVAAWQILSSSVLIALVLPGLMLAIPSRVFSTNLAEFLHSCVMALQVQYATPGGALLHASGVTLTLLVGGRSVYLLGSDLRHARRASADHLRSMQLAAYRDRDLDAFVVEHPTPVAYCLPGRGGAVVLTSATIAALSDQELVAVLTHERAHLRGRHHLVTATASALARTLPFVPGLRWAQAEQSRLLEMIADDEAAARGSRLDVARAVFHLAGGAGTVPAPALGAADVAAIRRVRRMLAPPARVGVGRQALIITMLAAMAFLPFVIAAAPAVAAAQPQFCPITITAAAT